LSRPGPFESGLTVESERALRAAGFAPTRRVLGATVFRLSTKGMWNCGATPFAIGQTLRSLEVGPIQEAHAHCRRLAFDRLAQECAGAGSDGVVATGLELELIAGVGHEYLAQGTAIRSGGQVRPPRPFVAGLSGKRFAALLRAGWVACGMAVGVGVTVRHDDLRTRLTGLSMANQELPAFTELVALARWRAREMLIADCARIGAEGLVLHHNTSFASHHECTRTARNYLTEGGDVQDIMVTVTMWGTGLVPFAAHLGGTPPELVINLNDL
jgi:uncharacterized protein YbjQ (UPF0145 family)